MSAELWRVIQDLEVGFVAVSCSHVSASIVELLMPQYSADRNKALQMLEGILGIAFHWMLGVQLFRLLVPLRYHNFPGTVFTVFAPLLLRQQYTKLLVAVQSIAGQTVKLLPSMLGDDSSKKKSKQQPSRTPEPLPPTLDDWDRIIDDLQKSILTDMREVMAEAQAAYVAGSTKRLAQAEQLLRDVLAEGTQDLSSLVQQGNNILEGLAGDARNRKNTVAQWQVSQRWKAFKEHMKAVAEQVATSFSGMMQSMDQMMAALDKTQKDIAGLEEDISKWREGGPPETVPDPQRTDYPYQDKEGQFWVLGPYNDNVGNLQRAQDIGYVQYDGCGNRIILSPGAQVMVVRSDNTLVRYDPPMFYPGRYNERLAADYYEGKVVVKTTGDIAGNCTYPKKLKDAECTQKTVNGTTGWLSCDDPVFYEQPFSTLQSLADPYPSNAVKKSDLYANKPFVW